MKRIALLPLLLSTFVACDEPLPAEANKRTPPHARTASSASAAAHATTAPTSGSATGGLAKPGVPGVPGVLGRDEVNRLAAELALPLFWTADKNDNGAVDADEVVTLWGFGNAERLSDKGKLTPTFDSAMTKIRERHEKGVVLPADLSDAEKKRRAAVLAELGQARPIVIYSDFRGASEEDRAIVGHVIAAARIVETIHAKQTGAAGLATQIPADDTPSQMLFFRNQGPWCEAPKTEGDPDCNAVPARPPKISGLYPAGLQTSDPKFCETLEKRKDQDKLLYQFATLVENDKGVLEAKPYHVAYEEEMTAVSRELEAAAAAVTSEGETALKQYLAAAAKAFLDDKWEPADEAWSKMNVDNSKWYLRIGPDEVYFEPCSRKAGFHVSFARINEDSRKWQALLAPMRKELEGELARMAGAPYKARNVNFHLPDFIDIVLNAGDSRSAFGATIGQSLPNWGPVANEGRGRTVAMTNLYTDEDSRITSEAQAKSLFCGSVMGRMKLDPSLLTMSTVLHEAAHNLGPAHEYKVDGKKGSEVFGGPLASMLEELKAQTSALYLVDWLAAQGKLPDPSVAQASLARDMLWAFGHISQGMYDGHGKAKPYSQLASIQTGAFLDAGAMAWRADELAANGTDKGCFDMLADKMPEAITALEKRVLGIKARGDKADGQALVAEYVDKKGTWADLRSVIAERMLRVQKASFVYAIDL